MVKILFLVKNGQKGRHGCVKSEHVLLNSKQFLCDCWGLRYLQNKMRFLIRGFSSKHKLFDLELPHILKTIKIKTDQFSQYGLLGHLRAIRSQLWPVGGTWRKYCRFEATIRHYEYGLICFRTAFCFVNISAP